MIVLDTNVLSEVLKPTPSAACLGWLAAQHPSSIFTTAITQAEILYGISIMPPGKRRNGLLDAIEKMFSEQFDDRILPFDSEAAREYAPIITARRKMGRPMSQMDGMIAAIARSQDAALATRNTNDFEDCGMRLIDPWSATG